jgi:hypothetical protein
MNVYDIALQIFLKRSTGGFVNDATKPGFKSEMRAAIELAELFLEVKREHGCERDPLDTDDADIILPESEL